MVNKIKETFALLVSRQMQIRLPVEYHLTPTRMARNTVRQQQMLARMWRNYSLVHCCWEYKMVHLLGKKIVGQFIRGKHMTRKFYPQQNAREK
jgi:hypothetical protein